MIKYILLLLLLSLTYSTFSQKGKVMESLEFSSKLVDYPVKYSIYLPPDYETSERSYPILYLLHGYSDDETGWIQFGEANAIADKGIASGIFAPCIIVMPDGGVSWFVNSADGKDPWEDMFIKEFIPFIEKKYRIRSKKEFRSIAGLSMGGNGSLLIAMKNTALFSSCVAMSAATYTDEEIKEDKEYNSYLKDIYGERLENNGVTEHWKANSPLYLLDKVDKSRLKTISWYIDCGDDDYLYRGNSALHIKMRKLGIPHEYRVREGQHNWTYWRKSLHDGLKYISKKFHR